MYSANENWKKQINFAVLQLKKQQQQGLKLIRIDYLSAQNNNKLFKNTQMSFLVYFYKPWSSFLKKENNEKEKYIAQNNPEVKRIILD